MCPGAGAPAVEAPIKEMHKEGYAKCSMVKCKVTSESSTALLRATRAGGAVTLLLLTGSSWSTRDRLTVAKRRQGNT